MIKLILDHSASETPERLRMLRLPQVCEATGLCRSSIYKLESERRFPSRIRLSGRAVAWVEHEVQTWIAERIELSRRSESTLTRST
jgi:prophage regulatory protein